MANEAGGIPAVSNPFAPDVFADEAVAFEIINDTVRITFGTVKMADAVPPSENQLVIVGRVVMTVGGAQRLALGLHSALTQKGLDPSASARDGGAVQ
jgi:hypothetical protein